MQDSHRGVILGETYDLMITSTVPHDAHCGCGVRKHHDGFIFLLGASFAFLNGATNLFCLCVEDDDILEVLPVLIDPAKECNLR